MRVKRRIISARMSQRKGRKPTLQELVDQAGLDVIGHRIRRLRTRQNYSIRDLADIAQVSKNTLLRLEQGQPTHLSTIVAVCKALKVKTNSVVGPETPQASIRAVHKVSDYVWMDMNNFAGFGNDPALDPELVRLNQLGPDVTPFSNMKARFGDGVFNPNVILLTKPTPRRSHRGDEFVWVVSGTLKVVFDDQEVVLQEEEACMFWAAEMHHYEPANEGETVKVLSIIIDPFPGQPVRLHIGKPKLTDDEE